MYLLNASIYIIFIFQLNFSHSARLVRQFFDGRQHTENFSLKDYSSFSVKHLVLAIKMKKKKNSDFSSSLSQSFSLVYILYRRKSQCHDHMMQVGFMPGVPLIFYFWIIVFPLDHKFDCSGHKASTFPVSSAAQCPCFVSSLSVSVFSLPSIKFNEKY